MTGEKTGIDIIDNCPECVFPVIICAEHFRAVRLALEGAAKAAEIVRAQMQDAWASASAELVRALAHLKPPVGGHLVTAYPWLRDGSVAGWELEVGDVGIVREEGVVFDFDRLESRVRDFLAEAGEDPGILGITPGCTCGAHQGQPHGVQCLASAFTSPTAMICPDGSFLYPDGQRDADEFAADHDAVHLFPLKTPPPERWSGEVMRLGEVTADGRLFAADVGITVRKRAPLWAGTDEASRERGPIGEILDVTTVGSRVYAHGVTSDQEVAHDIAGGLKFASVGMDPQGDGAILGAYVMDSSLYPWAPIRPWSGRESEGNFDDD